MAFPFENVLVLQLPGIIFCINRFSITKLSPLQNLNLGFFLKLFLRFRKFQPRHSYRKYCYIYKKIECMKIEPHAVSPVQRITERAFRIFSHLDWQMDNGFFKRPIMAGTQILVHRLGPRTRILVLFRR